jgi:N-acetyl-anhydromuramyl-L-alanine amidase AmpD
MFDIYGNRYCGSGDQYVASLIGYSLDIIRGHSYYASFTEDQYNTLSKLLDELCNTHKIQKVLLPEPNRYFIFGNDQKAREYTGICTHANFRGDKTDIGPAFEWKKI